MNAPRRHGRSDLRYWLALLVASSLGPYLALFGLDVMRSGLLDPGGARLSDAFNPLLLFVAAVYAVPAAILLAAVDSLVVRALRGRFNRLAFALAIVAAGLAAGAAFAFLISPDGRLEENLPIFLKLGGMVAFLWAILRPAPAEAMA